MASKSTFKYPFPEKKFVDRQRMFNFVKESYLLNRSAVNPETDIFVQRLQKEIGGRITESKAGEICLKWKTPDNWNVRHGRLLKLNGEVLVDFKDNPMYLWTHSTSFKGTMARKELIEHHVYTDENRPDARRSSSSTPR